jgi:hypothetical protein
VTFHIGKGFDSANKLYPGCVVTVKMVRPDGSPDIDPRTGKQKIRRLNVTDVGDAGFSVKWYTPEGMGPHFGILPHAFFESNPFVHVYYPHEDAGLGMHFFDTHPDFTGKYGVF